MKRDEVWTTAEGKRIKVGDMTETHVRNTLRMILRRCRESGVEVSELLSPPGAWNHDATIWDTF